MPYLILPKGRAVPVDPPHLIIGSDAACDLRLRGALVAPRHVIIQYDGQNWRLAKLNLNAVVWLNGRPLRATTILQDGDRLWVGETQMTWRQLAAGETPLRGGSAHTLWQGLLLLLTLFFGLWGTSAVITTYLEPNNGDHVAFSSSQQTTPQRGVAPPPTATATPDLRFKSTATPTLAPTHSLTETAVAIQPSSSPSPTLTATPSANPTPCQPRRPRGWQQITVRRGQTLSQLAQRYHTTVSRLKNVNCLGSDLILIGQKLWVPALPTP